MQLTNSGNQAAAVWDFHLPICDYICLPHCLIGSSFAGVYHVPLPHEASQPLRNPWLHCSVSGCLSLIPGLSSDQNPPPTSFSFPPAPWPTLDLFLDSASPTAQETISQGEKRDQRQPEPGHSGRWPIGWRLGLRTCPLLKTPLLKSLVDVIMTRNSFTKEAYKRLEK